MGSEHPHPGGEECGIITSARSPVSTLPPTHCATLGTSPPLSGPLSLLKNNWTAVGDIWVKIGCGCLKFFKTFFKQLFKHTRVYSLP